MQRFQVAFNLKAIPEAKQYLQFCLDKAKDHGDLDDFELISNVFLPFSSSAAYPEVKTPVTWESFNKICTDALPIYTGRQVVLARHQGFPGSCEAR